MKSAEGRYWQLLLRCKSENKGNSSELGLQPSTKTKTLQKWMTQKCFQALKGTQWICRMVRLLIKCFMSSLTKKKKQDFLKISISPAWASWPNRKSQTQKSKLLVCKRIEGSGLFWNCCWALYVIMRKRGAVPNHLAFSPVSGNTVITPVEPSGRWEIIKEKPRGWLAGYLGCELGSPEQTLRTEYTSQGQPRTDVFCCLTTKLDHPGC